MGRDRISELPDSLLTQILSYLPTKDSVKTSVLSNRWKFLWLRVPALDLRVDDFPIFPEEIFPSFIDSFLEFNRQSRMHKFKIRYNEYNTYGDRFREWIRTAVDRGVHHLVVQTDMEPSCRDLMPQNIFKSNTLVSLKLVKIEIENLGFVVSLPILKTMHLEGIWFGDDPLIIEKLISGCPVLEDLTLIRPSEYYMDEVPLSLRVRSQSLKWFRFTFENNGTRGSEYLVEIDAPRLEYLSFNDNQSDRILVKNFSSLSMVDIHTKFNVRYGGSPLDPEDSRKTDIIRGFLTGISSVRHMIISLRTIKVLCRYSELGTIPKFDSLYRLEATFSSSMLPFLPVFLESCPNLKNLILDFVISAGPEQTKLAYVPLCLSLNLECVEIKGLTLEEETWKQLAKYFLENSAVLRKLILRFKDTNQDSDVSKELLTYPKLSRKCQIIIN